MTANVSAAVEELENGDHAPVDLDQIVVVGQGMGAATAARLVAEPPEGLPAPTALMAITPHTPAMRRPSTLPEHMAALPAETRVVLVGAEGMEASDRTDLDHAWAGLGLVGQVPIDRRAYVVLRSDDHGEPGLVADEWVSMAHPVFREMGVDALDWYGTWKLLDGLMACTFNGEFCEYAFGNTPEVRSMGTWSDGVPVTEALVITDVATPEATPAG